MQIKYFILLIGVFNTLCLFAQNKYVVKDWEEYSFTSKYGNPITILWTLERSHKKVDYMDNRYHFYLSFKSRTKLNGAPQPVWVGFDIKVDGLERNLQFGQTLKWKGHKSWDFWHESPSPKVIMNVSRGWIGTYLNEIEDVIEEKDDCAEIVNQLGVYTGSEFTKDAYKVGETVSGFFDDDIAKFIAKYSKSASSLFKIASSKAFGIVTGILESDDLGTPLNAYEGAYEKAKGHVYVIEKQFTELGKLNSPLTKQDTNEQVKSEDEVDFWNSPENSAKTSSIDTEMKMKIIKSIEYSQKELKKELDNMDIALKGIETELILEKDDCRKKALEQYNACFKYNAEVLLSIK